MNDTDRHKAFEQGQRWARKHGSYVVHARRSATDNLGIELLISGWQHCPITPEIVGAELFDDPGLLVGCGEAYMREFVRGALIG